MKIQTRNVKLAIKKGNEIIADYKQHSNGKLTLWTSINNHTEKYNITAEAQSKVKPGITTAIVAQLPFSEFKYECRGAYIVTRGMGYPRPDTRLSKG